MSTPISTEALAEFIHVNCSREYAMKVIDQLDATVIQRNITIDKIYEVIEKLNELQPMLSTLQIITYILDAVLAIASAIFGAKFIGFVGGFVITGAYKLVHNSACNRKVMDVREAMIEDKRHRDKLQALLRQQDLMLPFEGIEFKAEMNIIREIVAAISKFVNSDSGWIKHLENIGILGITPALPSGAQLDTTDKSKFSISKILKIIMKSINALKGLVGNKYSKNFSAIKAIISMFSNFPSAFSLSRHPTASLLEASYVPELMHDVVMMQDLLEKLVRNYGL